MAKAVKSSFQWVQTDKHISPTDAVKIDHRFKMEELVKAVEADPSYQPHMLTDNTDVVIKHLTAYVIAHPEARKYEQLSDLLGSTFCLYTDFIIVNVLRATHTDENDANAVIDAREAKCRTDMDLDNYRRIVQSGLPIHKRNAMMIINRKLREGNKSCAYRMHDDGTADFYLQQVKLVAWLTELGYFVQRHRDDVIISVG